MSAKKFAKDGDWAEISEMSNRSLRKIIYEFAEEYHQNEINNYEIAEHQTDSPKTSDPEYRGGKSHS